MGEDQGAVSASVTDQPGAGQMPDDPQQLRADIERTREDLGDTVAALAEKTDVKARAKERVAEVRQTVTQKRSEVAGRASQKRTEVMGRAREASPESASTAAVQIRDKAQQNPVPFAAIAAFVGGFIAGRITGR